MRFSLQCGGQNNLSAIVYNRRMETGFFYWEMEHGFLSTIREWNMVLFLFHIGGWNRFSTPPSLGHSIIEGWKTVSTPPCKDGVGFRSTTSDWKDILGMGLPPLKNGTGFPLSEDGTGFPRHHWRLEENFLHSAIDGTRFQIQTVLKYTDKKVI